MPDKALIIFIKNPIKGKVKTRIAQTVGDDRALAIYLELSKMTQENALLLMAHPHPEDSGKKGITCYVFYADFVDVNDDWSNSDFEKQVQTGHDLGERMLNAFDFVLQKHEYACIIGSDCPTLSVAILQNAFDKLAHFDAVLGPSTDGGYYLLGLKNKEKSIGNKVFDLKNTLKCLFENMAWSTDQVLANTLERMKQNNQTVFLLPELTDIDEETDWLIFQKNRETSKPFTT